MSRSFEIRRAVALPVPPEQVWPAIATSEGQAGWFMPGPEDTGGTDVTADPPHRLEVRFGTQATEYVLDAADGSTTVLRFVHSGILDEDWGDEYAAGFDAMTGAGWDVYLFTLGEYLRHFPGRSAVYAEAEAPAAPDVWARVLTALGDPAVGDEVAGLGVVDHRTDRHLGIRTPTAFVRFHERSPIGLPVAVGVHDFTPGADAAALTTTWTDFLRSATP